jgi:predicted short-subunit dehydrogenase-like oxidoreductase (DUF2520 family)
MWELERHLKSSPMSTFASPPRVGVIGCGRLGTAIVRGLSNAGIETSGPLPRGADGAGFDAVVLCVPDSEIGAAAARVAPGAVVGHCSGACGLDVLAPHEAFSLHPLMTFTAQDGAERFIGAGAGISGGTERALAFARELATALRMHPFELHDADRAAYHAAASIASNFLITLEAAAERLAAEAGAGREILLPLVRATVENWARLGPERALTGPIARGDEATVARQRAAITERAPELLAVFDAMVDATRALAAHRPLPIVSAALS